MIFEETKLKGAYIIKIEKLEDERGFFGRSWCAKEMKKHGLNAGISQANVSFNKLKGTLRGMHFQKAPHQEAKLVRCSRGSIFDVIIDLRKNSPTFKQWIGVELTQDNYKMLYVPEDFAHGFITLEDNCEISYQMSEFYVPGAGETIRWNDPLFNIQWPLTPTVMSEKDKSQSDFNLN
ncbi:dTDP-4-dehydrorhamnose 3,5-epimerase [Mariniphaga anaerophila]|uniref:dTDP-4-dehydrorhamnose 3,5-epimerase n=1 Tax=Mariniphaga anaerophila TaxID=1484053 RepID=A0A1M5BKW0_9BACT|nr:dTDP-4-dehydrorhamnose 3,5-epimerase [Mariniphaga anaerophila]SHF43000.1 dTDP-4-dehydrorhamnose 3,5-epimerase [Mariniphaga anaerophila]